MRRPYDLTPSAELDAMILLVIEGCIGKPCPTRHMLTKWSRLPRRLVWQYLDGMCARGLLSVSKLSPERGPSRRKITLLDGRETDWTAKPYEHLAKYRWPKGVSGKDQNRQTR